MQALPTTHRRPGRTRPRRLLAATMVIGGLLAACTGTGGGWLPPDNVAFQGKASFGFTFSCERSSQTTQSTNPKPGRLRLELSYNDQGRNPIGGAFGIHGVADAIDPVLESQVCVGQEEQAEQPPVPGQLVFLGRYRLTSASRPIGFPAVCAQRSFDGGANCRFEVVVQDNDRNRAPSAGDSFSIVLTTVTDPTVTDLGSLMAPVLFYARGGLLGGGNISVDA
jgi:hypothetical protein